MTKRPTLNRRLRSLLIRAGAVFVPAVLVVAAFAYSQLSSHVVEDRLLLARTVAHHFDTQLSSTLRALGRLAVQLPSLDADAVPAMRAFRFQSDQRDSIYVLDHRGRLVVADPESVVPLSRELLPEHEEVTSLLRKRGKAPPTVALIQPFHRNGQEYFLVAEMNPVGSPLSTFLKDLGTEPQLHVVVVDARGTVIAAPDPSQLFEEVAEASTVTGPIRSHRPLVLESAPCSVCEGKRDSTSFLKVMVPLRFAPWGVLVEQAREAAFAALYRARNVLLGGGLFVAVFGIVLARALSRSLVAPIEALSRQAELVRQGRFDQPIEVQGDHEIVVLATTLDAARRRLATTLDELQSLNETLERQVASRTQKLREQYENLRFLNAVFRASAHESRPAEFLPEVLRLIAEHFDVPSIAITTVPVADQRAVRRSFPPETHLPWLEADAPPPDDWQVRELRHGGVLYGRLFHPPVARESGELMKALEAQLGLALHDATLLERTFVQDRQRRVLVRRLLTAGEEERKRIARELHDEISQLLTVIQLSLEETEVDNAGLRKAQELLTRTQAEIHRIIYDLRPSLLDDLGLAAAVQAHTASHLVEKGIQVSLEMQDGLRLPPEIETTAFRIYQEITTNILRHSGADNVSVELYTEGGDLVLGVEDDGVGFDPEEHGEGAGLVGMRERAALVGGTLSVNSERGLGTQVTARIPLKP